MRTFFEVEKQKNKINDLQKQIEHPLFWKDRNKAQKTLKNLKDIESTLHNFLNISSRLGDLLVLYQLAEEEKDEKAEEEIKRDISLLSRELNDLHLTSILSEEYDFCPAIMSLHAGAGGTESCDWVDMLLRMYLMWAQKQKYTVEIVDVTPGEVVGKKNVTFIIKGKWAFGKLKGEKGIHRLVRISPFDANKRRHTTFAGLDIIPECDDEIEVEIKEDDLKIETFRASGAGGQHVNKTSSAVRITHIPTGIGAACQSERSQHQNKQNALKVLRAKLYQQLLKEQKQKIEDLRGEQKDICWGSQIRSYIFHPYSLVKDHRTSAETSNVPGVMDGEIDEFIWSYLKQKQ